MAVTENRGSDATELDATLAVIAHGLLTSMSVIQGANLMLRQDWDRLPPERRTELLDMALLQADHTIGVLQDLMRGVAPDVAAELDRLTSSRKRSGGLDLR
jgi:hypothetical protein